MDNLCKWEKGIKILVFYVNANQKVNSAEEEFNTQVDWSSLLSLVSLFYQLFVSMSNGPMRHRAIVPKTKARYGFNNMDLLPELPPWKG